MKRNRIDITPGLDNWYQSDAIITTDNKKHHVKLDMSSIYNPTGPLFVRVVYWEDGEMKIIDDYISSPYNSTVIEFDVGGQPSVSSIYVSITGPGVGSVLIDTEKEFTRILGFSLEKMSSLFNASEITPSPLIVDLDGDGVETSGKANGVYFDHDGNGFAEKSGWVGKDDGLLVRDINGNGQIDNGTELFGNNSVLSSGQKAENGFEALKDLDSNHDGVFDNKDAAWNEVKVWKDSNQNGLVEDGELLTLEQANVSGMNLGYQDKDIVDENGNTIGQTGSFIKGDGSIGDISDIWFDADMADTADRINVEIPAEIKALPNITGFGNVHNLQTAMALDTSGELKALVEQFAAETDVAARREILINLIYHWTNVQDMDPRGRDPTQVYGPVLDDCRKLEALEEFMGKEFLGTWCWGDRDPNPHGKAAPYILKAFDELVNYVGSELLAQTHYKPLLENVTLTWNAETSSWHVDVSQAVNLLQEMYTANVQNGALAIIEFAKLIKKQNLDMTDDIISAFKAQGLVNEGSFADQLAIFGDILGTAGDDNLAGTARGDFISGENGNDTIYGNGGNDTLYGDNGNDTLWGEDGNDMLIGGAGDDYLNGGNGADTYFFEAGFGHDTIDNSDNNASADEPDIIQFGESIQPGMVTMSRDGFDLILTVKYAGTEQADDSVRILSYFDKAGTTSATPNNIIFADGTSWDLEYVYAHYNMAPNAQGGVTWIGTDGYDFYSGTAGNDYLDYGDGDDQMLYFSGGDDIIIGGKGNDKIDGRQGNNTYIYNLGDGCDTIYASVDNDTILFGEGIKFKDLTFSVTGSNGLLITIKNDPNQTIWISQFMWGGNRVSNLKFADGSVFHLQDAPLTLIQDDSDEKIYLTGNGDTVYGMGGNDEIFGTNADEIIVGGKGDDTLKGGYGNDTYVWNLGDGLDYIEDANGINDRIKFGEGIKFEDLRFYKDGAYLKIIVNNDFTQGVALYKNFTADNIEYVEMADGTVKSLTKDGLVFEQTDIDDQIAGTIYDDIIYGNGGNDDLSGQGGNDILAGGLGNDKLQGNYGDDTYIWNLGDGLDEVIEQDGTDKILFGPGISYEDLRFVRKGDDLFIYVKNDFTQGIKIYHQYNWSGYMVEKIQLHDGKVYDISKGLTFNQTDEDERIQGTVGDDFIYGNGGNDYLSGRAGNDTYFYNIGDGLDEIVDGEGTNKIVFGTGLSFNNLIFEKDGYYLNIYVNQERTEGIKIGNFYYRDDYKPILAFADGSEYDLKTTGLTLNQTDKNDSTDGTKFDDTIYGNGGDDSLFGKAGNDTLFGGTGNDRLDGGEGNDTLIGGTGNDYLDGGAGDDTYIYNLGDGFDTILDGDGNDKIVFGEGISQNNLSFTRDGNDFKIIVNNNEPEGIIISKYFDRSYYKIETMEFADGSTLNLSDAEQLIQAMSSFGVSTSANMDSLSNPSPDVGEIYNITSSSDLIKKAV